MRNFKALLTLLFFSTWGANNAFATTDSQILVMSRQLYAIAQDLTTGLFPTAILLIAIGMWGVVNVFGKGVGEGIHQ